MTREEIVKIAKGLRTDFKCESDIIVDFCNSIIKELEQEPRKGKWYRQTNDCVDYYECSECGIAMGIYDVKNYCPNCGSRNEVEE